ncbi:MAG: hypothetical protein ABEJ58_07100 [Halodesulfurarchaeum sp.]
MATQSEGRMTGHLRSVTVTSVLSLSGVVAGVASAFVAQGPTDRIGLIIAVAAMIANLAILRAVGVDVAEFGAKDHLYNAFMTFSMWFVTWGVFLTSGVSL